EGSGEAEGHGSDPTPDGGPAFPPGGGLPAAAVGPRASSIRSTTRAHGSNMKQTASSTDIRAGRVPRTPSAGGDGQRSMRRSRPKEYSASAAAPIATTASSSAERKARVATRGRARPSNKANARRALAAAEPGIIVPKSGTGLRSHARS